MSGIVEPTSLIILLFIYGLCVVSVVCNLTVLVVFARSKKLRSSTDIYLMNLVVSDILMSGLAHPLKLVTPSAGVGNVVCKLVMFLPIFTVASCINTMVAISFDRFYAIVRQIIMPKNRILKVVVAIWIISIATSAPQIYEYSIFQKRSSNDSGNIYACGSHGVVENFEMAYAICIVLACYVIPLGIICGNYFRVSLFIQRRSKEKLGVMANGTTYNNQVSKVRFRVLKMLVTVTVVFATLWLPYFVIFTIEEITDTDGIDEITWLHTMKTFLVILSTLSNPVIYALLGTKFRLEFFALFPCGRRQDKAMSVYATRSSVTLPP